MIPRLGAAPILAACLLAACEAPLPEAAQRPPVARPERPAPAVTLSGSTHSEALERYYGQVQFGLKSQGLLRTDRGARDTPYSARDLVENFERIALYEEYATVDGRIVARQTPSRLHRWEQPVRLQLTFGEGIPDRVRVRDRAAVAGYAARLGRVADHPISVVEEGGNFHVLIVDEEARTELGPRLKELIPGISDLAVETVLTLPRSSYCLVFALDPSDTGRYETAVAVIRAEHPDLLRLSCIHEEIAQGLGLSNDSPKARPSIFNDDEEFALLTGHDEMLLKMLYDPRLEPGMTPAEARPTVVEIANELLPGS